MYNINSPLEIIDQALNNLKNDHPFPESICLSEVNFLESVVAKDKGLAIRLELFYFDQGRVYCGSVEFVDWE
jgi:hypothetical protein